MACQEKINASECLTNSYIINGFESQHECMTEGLVSFKEQGFECGKNCEQKGLMVCEEICNSAGCH